MVELSGQEARTKRNIDAKGLCNRPENADKRDKFFAASALERREVRNMCGTYEQDNACPVREECLRWALEHKEIWGVWGGLDESELRRTLWVDSIGHQKPRSRFPNCPNCKARPSRLRVTQELDSSVPTVTCTRCGFSWHSRTSALAVRAYRRSRERRKPEVRVPRRRVVDQSVGKPVRVLPVAAQTPDDGGSLAMVASI